MWCVKCKSEFVEGITLCPVCLLALVDEEPKEETPIRDIREWTSVGDFNEVTSPMVEGLLNENNIDCRSEDIGTHSIRLVGTLLPQVRIWVMKKDAEKARKVLNEVENHGYCAECGAIALPNENKCPMCGSQFIRTE
jgi:predicted amidophosphoribosyltransferase